MKVKQVKRKREYISPKQYHALEAAKAQLHRDFNDLIEAMINQPSILNDIQHEYFNRRFGESFRVRIPRPLQKYTGEFVMEPGMMVEHCVVLTRTK